MDPLSHILSSIYLVGRVFCRSELTAPWGISLPAPDTEGASFHLIDEGSCWLSFEGGGPIQLSAGDLVIFPQSRPHTLADSPATTPLPMEEVMGVGGNDGPILYNGGGHNGSGHHGDGHHRGDGTPTTIICGVFEGQNGGAHTLFSLLPPLIYVKGGQGEADEWLRTTLKLMASEAASARPGSGTIVSRLADILFIQALRSWMESKVGDGEGWLAALRDPPIGMALGHIHQAPGEDWTVASLAAQVGMSRSAFSARFTAMVGKPPLHYLTRWRMQLAGDLLVDDGLSISEIAERVGYQSESPFSKAFKQHTGMAPGAYRRHANGRTSHAQRRTEGQAA